MAYTTTDLTNIETAIKEFIAGTRVGQVSIGDHLIKFADVTLADLERLRTQIKSEIGTYYSPRTYAKQGGRGY
jgi:hypothetical protein